MHAARRVRVELLPRLHEELRVVGRDAVLPTPHLLTILLQDECDHHVEDDEARADLEGDEEEHRGERVAAVALVWRAMLHVHVRIDDTGHDHRVVHQAIPRLARRAAQHREHRGREVAKVRVVVEVVAVRDVAEEAHPEDREEREQDEEDCADVGQRGQREQQRGEQYAQALGRLDGADDAQHARRAQRAQQGRVESNGGADELDDVEERKRDDEKVEDVPRVAKVLAGLEGVDLGRGLEPEEQGTHEVAELELCERLGRIIESIEAEQAGVEQDDPEDDELEALVRDDTIDARAYPVVLGLRRVPAGLEGEEIRH